MERDGQNFKQARAAAVKLSTLCHQGALAGKGKAQHLTVYQTQWLLQQCFPANLATKPFLPASFQIPSIEAL